MDDFQASMMEIFAVETNGFLDQVEKILMDIEAGEETIQSAVPEIFRVMHTIKSSSAMMSFENISVVAHKVEDLFYFIRENNPQNIDEKALADIVLDCVDFIRRNMNSEEAESPDQKAEQTVHFLDALKAANLPGSPADSPTPAPVEADIANENIDTAPKKPKPAKTKKAAEKPENISSDSNDVHNYRIVIFFKKDIQMPNMRAFELQTRIAEKSISVDTVPENVEETDGEYILSHGFVLDIISNRTLEQTGKEIDKSPFVHRWKLDARKPKPVEEDDEQQQESAVANERRRDAERRTTETYANVAVSKLDRLVDMAGEIIVTEMEIKRAVISGDFEEISRALDNIKKRVMSLQEIALSTRMVPLTETFHKLTRLVRDICRKQNKDVQFVTKGADTEVDRNIIDNVFSPLMHMLRNSIDHGIESFEARVASGKSSTGEVTLAARTEGRNVVITVSDDGRGINREAVLNKAVRQELITPERAAEMTAEEINALIFMPGFSTNEQVTEFSGRGVGMDVVNENMKKMSGRILINSTAGEGTVITLKNPLTLAIIDAIIISIGDKKYAIPMSSITEIFNIKETDTIRKVNGYDTYLLHDEAVRIVRLDKYFGAPALEYTKGTFMHLRSDISNYLLFVDAIIERQSVVVKSVPKLFEGLSGISGCTVLPDGHVSFILDTSELLTIS